jgi:flagellar protein FlaG
MIENISYSENINNVRGDGAALPPSSKLNETESVKPDVQVKEQAVKQPEVSSEKRYDKAVETVDPKELEEAIDRLNEKLYQSNRDIVFKTEKKINKQYISVIDKKSQEVIKEFPPKEIRKFLIGLQELEEKMVSNKDIKNLIINLEV